jgi:hypothetical protein
MAIWVFLPRSRLLFLSVVFCLVGTRAFGQQSYIPWSEGLTPTGNPTGSGSRPISTSSTGALFADDSSTAPSINFAQVYHDIQQTVPLPDASADSTEPVARPAIPSLPNEGLPQPPPPAAFTPGDSATAPDAFNTGPQTYEGFGRRLFKAYFGKEEEEEEEQPRHRQGTIVPFDSPPFPFADHIGPTIGYRDTTVWPLMQAIYKGPRGD